MRRLTLLFALFLIVNQALAAQEITGEKWLGTWKLNLDLSKASDDAGRRLLSRSPGRVLKFGAVPGGMNVTDESDNSLNRLDFKVTYNGKPVTDPNEPNRKWIFKQIDANTFNLSSESWFERGEEEYNTRYTVSADGKTLTATDPRPSALTGTSSKPPIFVYERQLLKPKAGATRHLPNP